MKHNSYLLISLFFLLFLFPLEVFAIAVNGSTPAGIFESSSAQGSIAEWEVNDTTNIFGYQGAIFSWGGPLTNASNEGYVLTIGPELEDEVVAVPVPVPEAVPVEEETPVSIPSSGGGGGGSSSRDTYGLVVGDILTVLIGGVQHTIKVTTVREDSAVLTITSLSQIVELKVGETIEIDLDSDSLADMSITLDAVSELRRITLTVEDLTATREEQEEREEEREEQEEIQAESLKRITGAVSGVSEGTGAGIRDAAKQKMKTIAGYIFALTLSIVLLLGSLFTARQLKKRRIQNVFQENKELLIRQELKKVEEYARTAVNSGKSVQQIKEVLLNAGWYENEIDEILVEILLKENGLNQIR